MKIDKILTFLLVQFLLVACLLSWDLGSKYGIAQGEESPEAVCLIDAGN